MTCGSIATILIVVFHFLKTFAIIKFSVELTQNHALSVLFHSFNTQLIIISSHAKSDLNQIASSQFK
jgi:hypothetical protein